MTDRKQAADAPPEAPPQSAITLDEFCRELSLLAHGPELIGGFHALMAARRRGRDTRGGFHQAFDDYRTRPITE